MQSAVEAASRSVRWRLPAAAAGMAALYYAGAKLGPSLTLAALPVSTLWPPNALLLAALILAPRSWWWALIGAAFPAHLLAHAQAEAPLAPALWWFAVNAVEALLAAWLLARLGGAGPALRSVRSVTAFLIAAAAAPLFTASLDASFIRAVGSTATSFGTLWEDRFLSNLLALLTFVPALVTCVQAPPGEFPRLARARAPEATALAAGLLAAGTVAFNLGSSGPLAPSLLCLPVPFLVWAALRFGPSFASTAYAAVAVLVIVAASRGSGPFAMVPVEHAALPIQLFLIALALPLLLLAGLREDLGAMERQFAGAQETFAMVFRTAPDALAITRRSDGRAIEANAPWRGLLGDPPREGAGAFSGQLDEASRRKLTALLHDSHDTRSTEVWLRDPEGRKRVLQLSSVAIEIGGQPLDIRRARDVTEQRLAEAEVRQLTRELRHLTRVASLTDFSGTLAHELSQPLAAILSNAQAALRMLAGDQPNVAEVRVILRDIAEADKRAGGLIHHLRLLMKDGNDAFAPLDANDLVRHVFDLVRGEFLHRKIALRLGLGAELPHVQGDRVQLQQLVLNLVMNACEAMQHGGGAERVLSVDTLQGTDGTVQILVGDTGPGIPPHLRDRIFEPFYTTKANGLGLGLPICRKIAAGHGGTLSLHDGPGQGACFRIGLPALQAARPGARAPHFTAGVTSEAESS